jgi:hypothetical protein
MGYYTIWLARVKNFLGSVLGIEKKPDYVPAISTGNSKPAALGAKAAALG